MGKSKELATGAAYVDASGDNITGRFVVGTGDNISPLTVERAGVDPDDISFDDEANNAHLTLVGTDARVRLQMGTMNTTPYAGWIQASYDNNASGTGNSGIEPLHINPKGGDVEFGGRVTMPYQPMFQAWANSGGNQHFAGGTNPSFSVVSPNVGNHFNGTTFTAPVAGRYLFSYSILAGTSGSYGLIALNVNNGPAVGSQHWTQIYVSTTNDGVNAATQILQLAANDQVNLYIHPTYNRFYWLGNYSRFCGYLLG